jgi:DNA sulfur modification protein DndC
MFRGECGEIKEKEAELFLSFTNHYFGKSNNLLYLEFRTETHRMLFDIQFIENEIIDQYLYDENPRPWIIGFSGGKDSTMLLQLVWNALKKVPDEIRTREVYIICNDTMVENPHIVSFINRTLKNIQKAATEQSMPFKVRQTTPRLEDTFWVNLVGRGYPAPNNSFRWCTERLKINPTTEFIKTKIGEAGEVVILLGTRSAESTNRAKSIKKHAVKGQRLRKHILPNAFVYAPIKDIETMEVWQYLQQVPPPWGGTNKELVTMYKNANSGDCPLVIDETTPSCGNSRFGCWVCTVVKRDKSMEGLIGNGEEWMFPLLDLRDELVNGRNIRENREMFRRYRRFKVTDEPEKEEESWGAYTPEYRAMVLRMILEAQKEVQATQGETLQLITHQELIAIQVIWYRDGILKNKVADIYNSIFNAHMDMSKHEEKFRQEEELLREVFDDEDEFEFIQKSLNVLKTKTLMVKKRGLSHDIENLVEEAVNKKKK